MAFSHGYILARVAVAYQPGGGNTGFAILMGGCAVAVYSLLGAAWLMMREAGELRVRAVGWARRTLRWGAVGAVGVSVVLDFSNAGVFLKWGDGSHWLAVGLVWSTLLACFVLTEMTLQRMISHSYRASALPYALVLVIVLTVLGGLAYSFFPYLVLDEITLWDAAAPLATLRLALSAVVIGDSVVSTLHDTLRLVRLILDAPDARRVAVAGDFNRWDAEATPLVRDGRSPRWSGQPRRTS